MSEIILPNSQAKWVDFFTQLSNAYKIYRDEEPVDQDEKDQVNLCIDSFISDYPHLAYRFDGKRTLLRKLDVLIQLLDDVTYPFKSATLQCMEDLVNGMQLERLTEYDGEANYFTFPSPVSINTVVVADRGSSYRPGMDITLLGGTFTTAGILNVDSISTIAGQTQADFVGGEFTGTFSAGNDYSPSDTIIMSDGTVITVDDTIGNQVTAFTITSSSTSGSTSNWPNLTQSSSSGIGSGFSMVLDDDNQAAFGVSVITAGSYTIAPSNPVSQDGATSPSGGTGATFTMTFA